MRGAVPAASLTSLKRLAHKTGRFGLKVDPGTGNTNYTVKADLKIAALTPSGAENLLKWGPSGFYVEMLDVFE